MGQKQIALSTCDKCQRTISCGKGILVPAAIIKIGMITVALKPGEYCSDCAAAAVGHCCPDDPPD